MNIELLNRLGIILNLTGSLLVAPELIGLKRLDLIEGRLEKRLNSIQKTLSNKVNGILTFQKRDSGIVLVVLTLPVCIINFILITRSDTIFTYIESSPIASITCGIWLFICILALLGSFRLSFEPKTLVDWLFVATFMIAGLPIYLPGLILSFLIVVIILGVIALPLVITRAWIIVTLRILTGRDTLRKFVVRFGLVLFVSGALLQLIATF